MDIFQLTKSPPYQLFDCVCVGGGGGPWTPRRDVEFSLLDQKTKDPAHKTSAWYKKDQLLPDYLTH